MHMPEAFRSGVKIASTAHVSVDALTLCFQVQARSTTCCVQGLIAAVDCVSCHQSGGGQADGLAIGLLAST